MAREEARAEERRLSRTEQAFEQIQRALVTLVYPPGSTFTEGGLGEQLGLTRTPMREALRALVNDGLVAPRPGAGYVVTPITLKDVRSIFAHWRRLGGDAIAMVATRGLSGMMTGDLIDLLPEASGADAPQPPGLDLEDFDYWHRLMIFHTDLVAMADDGYLSRDFDRLAVEIERVVRLAWGNQVPDGLPNPLLVLDPIAAERGEAARKALLRYLDQLEVVVVEALLSGAAIMSTNLGGRRSGG